MKLLRKTLTYTIIIGVIGVSFNLLFGANTITFVHAENINGFNLYKFDFWAYINNIKVGLSNPSELQLAWQTRTWTNVTGNVLQQTFWDAVINNLAYMLNCIIFAINLLIYPIRIAMFIGRTLLTIIGIDITNDESGLYWLVKTIQYMIQLQISYV